MSDSTTTSASSVAYGDLGITRHRAGRGAGPVLQAPAMESAPRDRPLTTPRPTG
jgi:hypothetical protein